jgi:hypothetical protein
MRPHTITHTDTRQNDGIDPDERELILLDDLRHEVKRLADAVERQNDLLEARSDGVREDQP